MPAPFLIESGSDDYSFPDVNLALREPDGLLAIGGDLSQERILSAYRSGIFPWYSEGQPLLWWSPDPRPVLFPEKLKISRSLRKTINRNPFKITLNEAFESVINACSSVRREGQDGTWITDSMIHSYSNLHQSGYAHSVEAWQDNKLVGGLYGIAIGEVFFGESMFSLVTDASKVAFVYFIEHLTQKGFRLIDCQVYTSHLESLGAEQIPRKRFIRLLDDLCTKAAHDPF
ncbi:MAG TPA: leucyl/phenylalanyl-tRNA--protein transferase [Gammaproteobacteria bacterium]|nr:leucyl/phenylalanyl-tRNA--protein transferase [Gammaproteobacteria bacterium]